MLAPSRMSYSSLNSFSECGERWRLERLHKINGGTWWATLAGSVIHEITEEYDKGELTAEQAVDPIMFALRLLTRAEAEKAKGNPVKASGRELAKHGKSGGPNKKDEAWWRIEGPKIVDSYITWRALTGWTIPTLWDGQTGIEVRLASPFAGQPHLGFIDRVFERPDGELVIVDIKTGKEPASKMQLGVYRVGMAKQYGLDIKYGAYWMGDKGDLVGPWDISHYDVDYIEAQYEMAWRGIEAGVFLPSVSSMCSGCGVKDFCRAVGGKRADDIGLPLIETIEVRKDLGAPAPC